jgi:NarL family two-component system response regulator LiaR
MPAKLNADHIAALSTGREATPENPIGVLLVEGHSLTRFGIATTLAACKDIEVLGEAGSAAQLAALLTRTSPDLVLLDLHLTDADGVSCIELIRKLAPRVKIAGFATGNDESDIVKALEAGACACLVKTIDPGDLPAAIRQSVAGTFYCTGSLGVFERENAAESADEDLSRRELEILERVAAGRSNRAIAGELWLSDQTVKFHLRNIYRKLGVANRTEAARYAYERGLLGMPA